MLKREDEPMRIFRTLVIASALLLLAAGCGDDETTDTGDLPVNTDDSGDVSTEPACLPDEPDCDDTVDVPDEGQDLPADDDGASSGMTVDGGLTIDEALALGPDDGIIAVQGIFFRDESGTFLCDVIAESLPPLCGEPRVALEGPVDEALGAPVQSAQGVQWTDQLVTLFGTIDDGVLTVDDTVA